MKFRLQLSGPAKYRTRSAAMLCRTTAEVYLRRLRKEPCCDSWCFSMELGTELLRRQLRVAFKMPNIHDARSYLDSLALRSTALTKVRASEVVQKQFKGKWVVPDNVASDTTVLYLHGGGYAFDPASFYDNLEALIAVSASARMFALDYHLTPEYRFPTQLEDAEHCYRWLLHEVASSQQLVVVGDSAGGNLVLALLLRLRDSKMPLPALAICLSPATDFEDRGEDEWKSARPECDWITQGMAMQWADWYCSREERSNPLVSPVNADLRGLPPIYIQAGGSEILFERILAFVKRAKAQGVDVVLDTWPTMNHDFQAFGYDVPESTEAIRRIGEVITSCPSLKRK